MTANSREVGPFPVPVAATEDEAKYGAQLRSMQDAAFCRSEKYSEQQARANRSGADPEIVEFERVFVKRLRKMNLPFYCHTMVRTRADQQAAWVRGVSKVKGDKAFPHELWAADIIHGTKGWDLTRKQWDIVGHIGLEVAAQLGLKIVWGGNFKSLYDPAHFELADWRKRAAERLGKAREERSQ